MHVHVSALTGIVTFLYVIVIGFLWRMVAAQLHDTPVGKAMSVIY